MTVKELKERMAALAAEGAALAAKHDRGEALTDAEADRVKQIRAEGTDLRSQLTAAQEQEAALSEFRQMDQHYNKPADKHDRGISLPGHERATVTESGEPAHWTIGDRFVRSEQFKQYREQAGMGTSMKPLVVQSFYEPHVRRARLDAAPSEQRALITSTVVTDMILPTRLPGLVDGTPRRLRARDVMANRQTDSNLIEYVKRATRTNSAAEVAEATDLTTGLKPESSFTLTPASSPVQTIAHITYATRNALDDMAMLRGIIEDDLRLGIAEREDTQLLFGNGTAPNLLGVFNTSGIQNLDAAYWTANPLPTAGAAANKWDRLMRAITQVDLSGQSAASAIVLNPYQVEEVRMMKDTTGNYLFAGGGPQGAGIMTVWGLPIVPHSTMAANAFLVGDFARHAIVFDRMAAQVFVTDSNRDLFERNIITFLAESRLALVVDWPLAFAKGVLA